MFMPKLIFLPFGALAQADIIHKCATLVEPTPTPPMDCGKSAIENRARQIGSRRISQRDFDTGRLVIRQSGYYTFSQDIDVPFVFEPLDITSPQHLGQVEGIRIEADDVVIDLAGRTMKPTDELKTFEPFIAGFKLGSNSFSTGKVGFGAHKKVSRVVIKDGTIEDFPHHGILGLEATDIVLSGLKLLNSEVAGIQLNNASSICIENSQISNAGLNVEWQHQFASLLQVRRRVYQIINHCTQNCDLPWPTNAREFSGWNSWEDVQTHLDAFSSNSFWDLRRDFKYSLGNSAGILIKAGSRGGTSNVIIRDVEIKDILVGESEMVGLKVRDAEGRLKDCDENSYDSDTFFDESGSPFECPLINGRDGVKCKLGLARILAQLYICRPENTASFSACACDVDVKLLLTESNSDRFNGIHFFLGM